MGGRHSRNPFLPAPQPGVLFRTRVSTRVSRGAEGTGMVHLYRGADDVSLLTGVMAGIRWWRREMWLYWGAQSHRCVVLSARALSFCLSLL